MGADLNPLGGAGAGNGNFTSQVHAILEAPFVVSVVSKRRGTSAC